MMLVCNEEKGGVGEGLHIFIQFVGGGESNDKMYEH